MNHGGNYTVRDLISALQEHPSGWPVTIQVAEDGPTYWVIDARSIDGPSVVLKMGQRAVVPPTEPWKNERPSPPLPATTPAEGQQGEAQCMCDNPGLAFYEPNPLCPIHGDVRDTGAVR